MNKTAIKNFAIWARNKLIADITYKAGLLGITEKEIKSPLPQSTRDVQFFDIGTKEPYSITGVEIGQRRKLVEIIQQKERQSDYKNAYKGVIEEVAYTWFNRLIAVRFMEVNDYIPSHVRVLSSESSTKIEPDLVTSPFDADLDYTPYEKDRIMQLKHDNKLDELFRMLFIKQCNALNAILPELFEKTNDYTELLMNVSFTDKDGVVYHLVHDIPEDDFNVVKEGQVEIIGWLYQYYNIEIFNMLYEGDMARSRVFSEYLPAATQMFTPDWAVRAMVENTLGHMWTENHPKDDLRSNWKYFLEETDQNKDIKFDIDKVNASCRDIKPEDIKFIDPCMGSGHILVYAFDVLMQIYESYGYNQGDAAKSVLENNLYGLDIDNRAYQLSYFAVMMKARQYNRRILNGETICHVYAIRESNAINLEQLKYFGYEMSDLEHTSAMKQMNRLLDTMKDAKEYGSILNVEQLDWNLLNRFVDSTDSHGQLTLDSIGLDETQKQLSQLVEIAAAMVRKYDVVVTNPPYLNSSRMSPKLSEYLAKHYSSAKADISVAMYMTAINQFTKVNGYISFITTNSWMYLKSFEKIRKYALENLEFKYIIDFGTELFDGKVGHLPIVAWVNRKAKAKEKFLAVRLTEYCYGRRNEKEQQYFNNNNYFIGNQLSLEKIPGSPIAYWATDAMLSTFKSKKSLGDLAEIVSGMTTGNNDLYLREWYEVNCRNIAFGYKNISDIEINETKWIPYNKGGEQRKWYGNNEFVVNWSESHNFNRAKTTMTHVYLQQCITWSDISGNTFAGRFCDFGFMFDVKGSCAFADLTKLYYLIGIFNSKITPEYVKILNPTTTTQVGDLKRIPLLFGREDYLLLIEQKVKNSISIAKAEWDSFEISWDFKTHPLISAKLACSDVKIQQRCSKISSSYDTWTTKTDKQFIQLKANEEELNRTFIEIYDLQNELMPEVEDKDVAIRKADLGRDMRSFISYAVGCMFGRYSLDVDGLAYAGGEWDDSKYNNFIPDIDNILPITDEEYFEDDVVGLFCAFLKKTFGAETLEENLDFIAKALGNKGNSPREIIRNYFLKDFFKDHCKIYQKRPIYWLFDSGKADGFKALVYMHRYNEDTIGNLRIDYLHRMQRVYESEISRMQETIENSTNTREVTAAQKRKERLTKQLKETKDYDEKIAHLALARISIDLDDGVKVNYEKVQTGTDGKKLDVLAKI